MEKSGRKLRLGACGPSLWHSWGQAVCWMGEGEETTQRPGVCLFLSFLKTSNVFDCFLNVLFGNHGKCLLFQDLVPMKLSELFQMERVA